jgi:hypothetical protein
VTPKERLRRLAVLAAGVAVAAGLWWGLLRMLSAVNGDDPRPGKNPVAFAGAAARDSRPAGVRIESITGAPTRVVWVQDVPGARSQRLMGLDSRDGAGERTIVKDLWGVCTPLITPDGQRVMFTHGRQVQVVNWDGTGLRKLVDGQLADVWVDPADGTEWVYVVTGDGDTGPVRRFRSDDPGDGERAWDRTDVTVGRGGNFQLSADGTRAAGMFTWPDAAVAELPNRTLGKVYRGCWTSMAPDNSYMWWILDGRHRNVRIQHRGKWVTVDIHRAPGIDGWEVYHPRWSNRARFITMTGPYKEGPMGGNNIPRRGPGVEVYLGRFNESFTAIESWVRVTGNEAHDSYGDAWIAEAAGGQG